VIRHARHTADPRPLDPNCACLTCGRFSRAYLRHLVLAREPLAVTLNTIHNVTYYQRLMRDIRAAIASGTLAAFAATIGGGARENEEEASCPA
jgi:queuine tRNA-ribosyltransferase